MQVKPGPVKRIFAPYKGERLSTLSWNAPPTPPGARKRKAAEMAAAAFVRQPSAREQVQVQDESSQLPGPPNRANGMDSSQPPVPLHQPQQLKGAAEQRAVQLQQQLLAAELSDSSSDERVVDFMSDDEDNEQVQANSRKTAAQGNSLALSRFDDSDEEQDQVQGQVLNAPQTAIAASTATTAADLSKFDDSDSTEPEPDSLGAATEHPIAAAAAPAAPAASSNTAVATQTLSIGGNSNHSDTVTDVTSAPDINRQQQSHADQQQQQQHAVVSTAAADLSRFDDSDNESNGKTADPQPVYVHGKQLAMAAPSSATGEAGAANTEVGSRIEGVGEF